MLYSYFVYVTTNENKTTLYIGLTNDIQKRLSQHYFDSQNLKKSFAGKYNCYNLIYYEGLEDISHAILREKEIKKWRREKKEKLIFNFNPNWDFLNSQVVKLFRFFIDYFKEFSTKLSFSTPYLIFSFFTPHFLAFLTSLPI